MLLIVSVVRGFLPPCPKPCTTLPGLSWKNMTMPYPASLPRNQPAKPPTQTPAPRLFPSRGWLSSLMLIVSSWWAKAARASAVSDLINQAQGLPKDEVLTGGSRNRGDLQPFSPHQTMRGCFRNCSQPLRLDKRWISQGQIPPPLLSPHSPTPWCHRLSTMTLPSPHLPNMILGPLRG